MTFSSEKLISLNKVFDFGTWSKSTSCEIKSDIRKVFETKNFKPLLIVGSNAEHRTLKAELSREYRVVHVTNPFTRHFSYNLKATDAQAFFKVMDYYDNCLLDVQLPAKEIGPNAGRIWFNHHDIWEGENTIFAFKEIDLFDSNTQYSLSRAYKVPGAKNLIILLIDKNNCLNHINKEMLNNVTKIVIDNTQHAGIY
jgi:hypothetical protein